MKKLLLAAAMLCAIAHAQVPVSPIVQPHMTFVNGAGLPCAGCSLFSFAAGTTTPLATYTDATGTTQNTNPIILGADGGPTNGVGINLGPNSYKLILKDASGATVWTADKVNAAQLLPCASANAIQSANTAVNGLSCDPTITINPNNHTISIGTLPANHVTIGALGTPTSWTFDTTSPATALASLGAGNIAAGTANQIAVYPGAGSNIAGSSSIPAGITAITASPGDNSTKPATTAYVALPGAINPTSVQVAAGVAMTGNQGNGTLVQHSTGATTTNDLAKFDANGNVVDSGVPVSTPKLSQDLIVTSLCITGTAASATCTTGTATWPSAFADTSYTVVCTPGPVTSGLQGNVYVTNKTTTGFQLIIQNGQNSAAVATTFGEVDCHGTHL